MNVMNIEKLDEGIIFRFWKKVNIRSKDDCWEWTGALKKGYGQIHNGDVVDGSNKMVSVHRLSWIIHFGPIPEDKLVLHKCDNKRCINPNHLYLGTHSDNIRDRVFRNPNSFPGIPLKFNLREVQIIRDLYSIGEYSQRFLAFEFSCCENTINRILNNKGNYI